MGNSRTIGLMGLTLAVAIPSVVLALAVFSWETDSKAVLVVMGDYVSGETATATIHLDCTELDEVYEVMRSCGCVKVRSDGEAPKLPFRIPTDGGQKLDIELETLGIVGKYQASISFLGTLGNRKVEKRFDLDVSAFTGWRVEPGIVQFEDCDEGQLLHSTLSIYRHERAGALLIEDVSVSNESRMNLNLSLLEPNKRMSEGDYELYATIKLGFTFETSRPTESVRIVGGKGKVRLVVPVLAKLKADGLEIKPKTIFRKRNETAKSIMWIEHSSHHPPKFISEGSNFQVEFEDSVQKDQNRSVTKALIGRNELPVDDFSKSQKLVIESTGSRAEVEIILED